MNHPRRGHRRRGTDTFICPGSVIRDVRKQLDRIEGMMEMMVPAEAREKIHRISRVVARQKRHVKAALKRNT